MNVFPLLKKKWLSILFAAAFLYGIWLYFQYFQNLAYPDEYDNFVSTWLITKGLAPYKDYFSIHLPSLFFLGVPAELLSHSKLAYRLEVFFFYFAFFLTSFLYLKNFLKSSIIPFVLFSSYAIALYGGQQFADGFLWSITILSAFFIVAKNLGNPLTKREVVVFSFLAILTFLSSPVHILAFIFFIFFHIYSQKNHKRLLSKNIANLKVLILSVLIPLCIFGIYLILTNSVSSFYQNTINYNKNYYYQHLYTYSYVNFQPLDYYLHTSRDFINHIYEISKNQGPYLINFLQALKSIIFHPSLLFNAHYLQIISSMFYDHFLTFEVLALIFYIAGFIALFKKNKSLAVFTILFIFALRIRINERIHMAPYYLFSYWMISTAIAIFAADLLKKKMFIANSLLFIVCVASIITFIQKNDYDFRQIAYNHFSYGFEETVTYLK